MQILHDLEFEQCLNFVMSPETGREEKLIENKSKPNIKKNWIV